MAGPTFVGGLVNPNPILEGYTLQDGPRKVVPTTLAGLDVDVTKPETVKSVTGDITLTFSATPGAGHEFRLTLNADGTARTVTLPASIYSIQRQGVVGSVVVPANGTLRLLFTYTGARWEVLGDPGVGFSLGDALADGAYAGITEPGVAGAALAFGDLVYLNNDDTRWELVDANLSDGYNKKLGICVQAAAGDGSATTILVYGKVRADSKFPTMTVGAPVFMSETAGEIVVAAPTTAAAAVRVVGFANTADELHFHPSPDTIVLA